MILFIIAASFFRCSAGVVEDAEMEVHEEEARGDGGDTEEITSWLQEPRTAGRRGAEKVKLHHYDVLQRKE